MPLSMTASFFKSYSAHKSYKLNLSDGGKANVEGEPNEQNIAVKSLMAARATSKLKVNAK